MLCCFVSQVPRHTAVRLLLSPASFASKDAADFAGVARQLQPDLAASGTVSSEAADGTKTTWRW